MTTIKRTGTVWQMEEGHRRVERVKELETHLARGGKIKVTYADGHVSIWPDCSPFVPEANTPGYLAAHIEAREYGFGLQTELVR